MKSHIMVGLAILIGLVIVVILFLPVLLDLNRYRDRYLPILEQALHRSVDVQDVRLTLFPKLGIRVKGLTIADDPALSPTDILTIPSAEIEIQWLPLLSRQVQVEHVRLHDPTIHIVRTSDGKLNIATIGNDPTLQSLEAKVSKAEQALKPLFGVFAMEQFTMTGGILQYEDRSQVPSRFYHLEQLELVTNSVQIGQTASLHMKGTVMPSKLPLEMNGRFGRLQPTLDLPMIDMVGRVGKVEGTVQGTFMDGRLELDLQIPSLSTDDMPMNVALVKPVVLSQLQAHLMASLVTHGPSGPSARVMVDPVTFDLQAGGSTIHLTGKGTPGRLNLSGEGPILSSQDFPLSLSVQHPFSLEQVRFEAVVRGARIDLVSLNAQAFRGSLEINGAWDETVPVPMLALQGSLTNFAVESTLRAVRTSLPGLTGIGTLHWNVAGTWSPSGHSNLKGPVRLRIQDGQFIGFDAVQAIEKALQLPDLREASTGATKFSVINAKMDLEDRRLVIRQLTLEAPDFSLTGAGSLGFDQSLQLHGNLAVLPAIGDRIIQRYPMAKVAQDQGRLVLPFTLKGTTRNPLLQLDTQSFGHQVKTNVERRIEKVLQGDDRELQQLLQDGADILKQLFGQ